MMLAFLGQTCLLAALLAAVGQTVMGCLPQGQVFRHFGATGSDQKGRTSEEQGGASFVQRRPSDSEKRAEEYPPRKRCVPRHDGAREHSGKGGWAGKMKGVWGALPPTCKSSPPTRRGQSPRRTPFSDESADASFGTSLREAATKRVGGWAKPWGVWGGSPHMGGKAPHMQAHLRWTTYAAYTQATALACAFTLLTAAFLRSDFSIALVADHSHSAKPWIFKLAAVWGNHEGSLALWTLVLALAGACLAAAGRDLPNRIRAAALAVQGLLGALFLAFLLFASNPFARLAPPPTEGQGLNPILQDIALAWHPPFLYLGYVGLSLPFSLAVAALLLGEADRAWARWLRLWSLAAWSMLTIGIALGSWWAYRELGWGGFWFWDPVENASFMPWLVSIALLHCAMVAERRGALRQWSVFLALLGFSLAVMGTFLVRSGVLVSVHSFAVDPTRGIFVLAILAFIGGGGLLLFAFRGRRLGDSPLFAPISREGAVLFNNLLLCCGAASVLVGTLYPLILESVGGDKISVGPPFFHLAFAPLMLPLFALLPFGPALMWREGDAAAAAMRLWPAAAAGGVALVAASVWRAGGADGIGPLWALFVWALGVWVITGAACEVWRRARAVPAPGWRRRLARLGGATWGMSLAHMGVGVLLLGVVALSAWSEERIEALRPGEAVTLAGWEVAFGGMSAAVGENYLAARALLLGRGRDGRVVFLEPERRFYPARGVATSEVAIASFLGGDLYVVLGDAPVEADAVSGAEAERVEGEAGTTARGEAERTEAERTEAERTEGEKKEGEKGEGEKRENEEEMSRIFRLHWNPLVGLIWFGAAMMATGGLCALVSHLRRRPT